ncbi:MobF family relaxase [Actinomadura hibisca]|uniref:MobF family relaxase n=1 Tax=Actinomadura hibisca TaxID=68565 RepID=UPI00083326BA|nr:MobF family relaxase [Actinomadura hibisca]
MMTIHKITAGDGYTYLTRQVAGGDVARERGQDATAYYTAKGNPAGWWMGQGIDELNLDGQVVTEEQMRALYGLGMHPEADRLVADYLDEHLKAGMTDAQRSKLQTAAIRHATLGRRFPEYAPLAKFANRVDERLRAIEEEIGRAPTSTDVKRIQAEESRRVRTAVAGFDVVFAPVKSAALLWALDPRGEVRLAVRDAHEAARDAAMAMLEQHAALTRTGRGGLAQIETRGLVAAVFEHRDSRAGDPNLHTHVAISSKIQGIDGKWRSLDARALYRATVAVSEFYNTRFETELTSRLPLRFTTRADTRDGKEPIREIAGIPLSWIEHFSSRRTEIEARYEQLLREFRREHGYDPNIKICHQLARQANLDTREGKKAARSLEEMRTDWEHSFTTAFGKNAVEELFKVVDDTKLTTFTQRLKETAGRVLGIAAAPEPQQEQEFQWRTLPDYADLVVGRVGMERSTWTVWNLRAEAERIARQELELTSPAQHEQMVNELVALTLSPDRVVRVDQPSVVPEPASLRRSDGTSVFVEHAGARFTSRAVLDAEDRLVAAARTATAVGLAGPQVTTALEGFDAQLAPLGLRLDAGQRQLVTTFATDNRLIVVGLGPAGAGKTTAMRAYAHVTAQAGQRILPLATSAAAAEVLGRELGMKADNLHKMITEYTSGRYATELNAGQRVPVWARMYALSPGDVILLDEAGMAGSYMLDQLVKIARRRGAVIRLLGDHRQLGAVESGGALRLIAHETGAVELSTLYRFTNPDEADATLKVRVGDSSGLDFYFADGRVRAGSKTAMVEAAYDGWKADMLAGKTTMMAAATNANVVDLSAQARRDRVEAGQVEADGVALHDGNIAGKGDWIVTRHNDRKLRTGRGDWVKNGDAWTVIRRHDDGSLTVKHMTHRGTITLPADYVGKEVELLYASTTNREQGSTVDTAHPLITPDMVRENFYVISTRARERTTLYIVTHELLAFDPDDRLDRVRHDARQYAAREILENILSREGNELSATESLRQAADDAVSLATLAPRHDYGSELIATDFYTDLARQTLPRPLADALTGCESWPQAVAALTAAEHAGWPAVHLLNRVARDGELLTTQTPGQLLAWRINDFITDRPAPAPLARPTADDTRRYADLLSGLPGASGLDPAAAAKAPAILGGAGAPSRAGFTSSDDLADFAHAAADALRLPTEQVTGHRAWPHLAASLAAAHRSGRSIPELLGPLATQTLSPSAATDPGAVPDRVTVLSRNVRRLLRADPATGPITMPHQLKHTVTATAALGHDTTHQLRSEPAWAALDAALRRAERSGHDPITMLKTVAQAREYQTAERPAQALAWRLNRYLSTQPDQPTAAPGTDWRLLAWTMKGLEERGVDLTQLLSDAQPRTLTDAMAAAWRVGVEQRSAHDLAAAPLPWISRHDVFAGREHELTPFFHGLDTAISARVRSLTATVLDGRPAWSVPLGTAPENEAQRAEWERHVAIVAAYRDQAKVVTDDARQILGPYAEAGRHDHTAYWHAVDSILTARRLAGFAPEEPQSSDERARAQVATDLYLALPADERAIVQDAVTERRGTLWFGGRIGLDDTSVIHLANTRDLQNVLAERGHLDRPEREHTQRTAQPPAQQPVEVETADTRQRARQATERTARMEAARLNDLRSKNRRARQQPQRVQTQRTQTQRTQAQQTQTPQATPTVQPQSQQEQRQQRRFRH